MSTISLHHRPAHVNRVALIQFPAATVLAADSDQSTSAVEPRILFEAISLAEFSRTWDRHSISRDQPTRFSSLSIIVCNVFDRIAAHHFSDRILQNVQEFAASRSLPFGGNSKTS